MDDSTPVGLDAYLLQEGLISSEQLQKGLELWMGLQAGDQGMPLHLILRGEKCLDTAILAQRLNQSKSRLFSCSGCTRDFVGALGWSGSCPHCSSTPHMQDLMKSQVPTLGAGPMDHTLPSPSAMPQDSFGDRYEVIRRVGGGGMGEVFLARDKKLGREVAIKVLRSAPNLSDSNFRRFEREGRMLAAMVHPHIVSVFDLSLESPPPFLVMEYVPGQSFETFLGMGQSVDKNLDVLEMAARGMEALHQRGIVHRDLKPSNVLVDDHGNAKVTDFGLAKQMDGNTRLTQTGQALGTPYYMAPEQVEGDLRRIGPTTDVYALGVMLFRILAGQLPFQGMSVPQVYQQIISRPFPSLRTVDRSFHPKWDRLCCDATAFDPTSRFDSAGAFADALASVRKGFPLRKRGGIRRGLSYAIGSVCLCAVSLFFVMSGGDEPPPDQPKDRPSLTALDPTPSSTGSTPRRKVLSPGIPSLPLSRAIPLPWEETTQLIGIYENIALFKTPPSRYQRLTLYALDLETGKKLWRRVDFSYNATVRLLEDVLILWDQHNFMGISVLEDSVIWDLRSNPDRELIEKKDRVFVIIEKGKVYYHGPNIPLTKMSLQGSKEWRLGPDLDLGVGPFDVHERDGTLALVYEKGVMLLNAETGKWFDRWANARASKERKTRIYLFDEGRSLIRWLIGARSKKTILRLNRDGDEWKTDWSLPCPRPTQFLGADDYSVATHTRVGSDEFFVLYTLANGKKWHSKSGPMCWVYREGRIYILIDTGEMEVLRPGKGSLESLTIPVDLDPQATFLIFDLKESGIGVKVGDTVYGLDPMTFSLQWKFELPEDFHEDSVPRRTRSGAIAVHGKKGVSLFLPSSNARDAGEETD